MTYAIAIEQIEPTCTTHRAIIVEDYNGRKAVANIYEGTQAQLKRVVEKDYPSITHILPRYFPDFEPCPARRNAFNYAFQHRTHTYC